MVALRNDRRGLAFAHLWETVLVVIMMVATTWFTYIAVTSVGEREVERSLNDQRAVYADIAAAQMSAHVAVTYADWAADNREIAGILESIEPAGYNTCLDIWVSRGATVMSFDSIEGFDTTHYNIKRVASINTGNFRAGAPQYISTAMVDGYAYRLVMAEEQ